MVRKFSSQRKLRKDISNPYQSWFEAHIPAKAQEHFPLEYPRCMGKISNLVYPFLYYSRELIRPCIDNRSLMVVPKSESELKEALKNSYYSVWREILMPHHTRTKGSQWDKALIFEFILTESLQEAFHRDHTTQ